MDTSAGVVHEVRACSSVQTWQPVQFKTQCVNCSPVLGQARRSSKRLSTIGLRVDIQETRHSSDPAYAHRQTQERHLRSQVVCVQVDGSAAKGCAYRCLRFTHHLLQMTVSPRLVSPAGQVWVAIGLQP